MKRKFRDILRLLLEGEGYAVLTAEDGREAIAEAAAEVDLYILDVNMPEVSGFPAAAEIRKHFDAPIVFLTAYSTESDKVMGLSVGADDYIVKPFFQYGAADAREGDSAAKQRCKSTCGDRENSLCGFDSGYGEPLCFQTGGNDSADLHGVSDFGAFCDA